MSINLNSVTVSGNVSLGRTPGPYAGQVTSPAAQNVTGTPSSVSFFFRSDLSGTPNLSNVEPGWYVTGHPDWIVTNVENDGQLPQLSWFITITGGQFASGDLYTFTGV